MKSFVISILSFYIFCKCATSQNVSDIVTMAIKELKPHHIVFWKKLNFDIKKKTEYLSHHQQEAILNSVLKKVPTTLVDLNKPPPFAFYNRKMLRKSKIIYEYNINISAPLHLFYFHDKTNNLKLFLSPLLKMISDSVMYLSTPKCLFVLYQTNRSIAPINDMLKVARGLQFVDFTVIQLIPNNPPTVFYYNMSSNRIEMQSKITRHLKLFPDKLTNMNGYNMRVGVYRNAWPVKYQDNKGYPLHLKPLLKLLKAYEHFSVFLNVTSTFVLIGSDNVEMSLDAYSIADFTYSFTNGYIREYSMFIAIVPLIHETKVNLSIKIVCSFIGIIGTIVTILLYFKYSQHPSEEWTVLLIFQLMLGLPSNFQPLSIRSKVVYIILLMFSIFFIFDLVSNLAAIDLETKTDPLVTDIDHIFEKNLSLVSGMNNFLNEIADSSDERVNKLLRECKKGNLYSIKENEVFITAKLFGEILLYDQSIIGMNNFTLVDINLPIIVYTNTFKELSPFREKFDEIETRIIEFGLNIKWANDLKVNRPVKEEIEADVNDEVLLINLLFVIVMGSLLSIMVFIFELIWYRISMILDSKLHRNKKPGNVRKIAVEPGNSNEQQESIL